MAGMAACSKCSNVAGAIDFSWKFAVDNAFGWIKTAVTVKLSTARKLVVAMFDKPLIR